MASLTTFFFAILALSLRFTAALNPIVVKGQELVDSKTNERFVILGVAYQIGGQAGFQPQNGIDPLSNGTVCLRDAALLQSLGVNTVRVYNVEPSINHDECMSYFNAAGIYAIVDVNAPFSGESLDRSSPNTSYTASYLNRTFNVVEAFKGYPNTLGFFSANEVMNDDSTAEANPPFIRAVTRDLKQYIAKHGGRAFPVGYSAADVRDILQDTWNYFQCNIEGETDSDTSRSDMFGLNSYSWCGDVNTFQTSGYDVLAAMFQPSSIPVFFSEYGCNKVEPRTFPEVAALYGSQMTMLSGGLVYQYWQDTSDFGLVDVNDNSTLSLLVDFDNLQKQYNNIDVKLLQTVNSSTANLPAPQCSSSLIQSSSFSKSFTIPQTPSGAVDLINNGVPNPPVGKLVDVSSNLKVPMAIYALDGTALPQLSIKPVSSSNTPDGAATNNGTSGSAKKGAAPGMEARGLEALFAVAISVGVWTMMW